MNERILLGVQKNQSQIKIRSKHEHVGMHFHFRHGWRRQRMANSYQTHILDTLIPINGYHGLDLQIPTTMNDLVATIGQTGITLGQNAFQANGKGFLDFILFYPKTLISILIEGYQLYLDYNRNIDSSELPMASKTAKWTFPHDRLDGYIRKYCSQSVPLAIDPNEPKRFRRYT